MLGLQRLQPLVSRSESEFPDSIFTGGSGAAGASFAGSRAERSRLQAWWTWGIDAGP